MNSLQNIFDIVVISGPKVIVRNKTPDWLRQFANSYGLLNLCILVAGLIGNVLTLLALKFDSKCRVSTRYLMAALALADTMSLFRTANSVAASFNRVNIERLSNISLKLYYFGIQTTNDISKLILLILALERLYVIFYPIKASTQKSNKPALLALLSAILLSVTKNGCTLWRYGVTYKGKVYIKYPYNPRIYEYISYSFSTFIILLLIVFNITIIVGIKNNHKNMKQFQETKPERSANEVYRKSLSATKMVFGVSVWFLLSHTPIAIYMILNLTNNLKYLKSTHDGRMIHLAISLSFILLKETNNAINFYVYMMASSNFRRVVFGMLCCKK